MVTTETVQFKSTWCWRAAALREFACGGENEACAASDSLETECCLLIATPIAVTTGNLNGEIQLVK